MLLQLINGQSALSTNFRENIRQYNSSLSFASMGEVNAKSKAINGKGPYCYQIHGQVYHCTSALYPTESINEEYAQLYILDPKLALDKRLQIEANKSNTMINKV